MSIDRMTDLAIEARFPSNHVETLARAIWTRCRSSQERKSGATWESISPGYRQAWIDGVKLDLEAANLHLARVERYA